MKVEVKNFQSIASAKIDISGFTVLVGDSNIGKSAMARAIQYSLFGWGRGFVAEGADFSEVRLSDGNYNIQWKKGPKVNQVTINGNLYDKVGRDIPFEIVDLGFKEIQIGTSVVNVQVADQFNPIFVLNDSGSATTLALLLTEVSRLGRLNTAMGLCSKDLKRQTTTLGSKTELRDNTLKILNDLQDKWDILPDPSMLISKAGTVTEKLNRLEFLERSAGSLDRINNELRFIDSKLSIQIPEFDFSEQIARINILQSYYDALVSINKSLEIQLPNVPELDVIEEKFNLYQFLLSKGKSLVQILEEEDQLSKSIESMEKREATLVSDIKKMEVKLGVCPLCERSF